jgi:hypothetical protein
MARNTGLIIGGGITFILLIIIILIIIFWCKIPIINTWFGWCPSTSPEPGPSPGPSPSPSPQLQNGVCPASPYRYCDGMGGIKEVFTRIGCAPSNNLITKLGDTITHTDCTTSSCKFTDSTPVESFPAVECNSGDVITGYCP